MLYFGLAGPSAALAAFLQSAGPENVLWVPASVGLDALLIPPDIEPGPCSAPTVLAPPASAPAAAQLITYGLGPQETLTFSALDTGCVLSLQRDIITLQGRRLERQELPLPPSHTAQEPELLLALCGALLTAGVAPEALGDALGPGA